MAFWETSTGAACAFDMICKCIGVFESDSASLSTDFASLLFVRVHVLTVEWIQTTQCEKLETCLLRQSNRILCPVHYLMYVCDPFYFSIRERLVTKYNAAFLQFNNISMHSHCHSAFRTLSNDHAHYDQLLDEFMHFCIAPDDLLTKLCHWHPSLLWGQLKDIYPNLSTLLVDAFKSPLSTDGI